MSNKISTIKERILQIPEIKGVTKQKFFKDIGMSYGNFTGKSKETPLNSNAIGIISTIYPDINLKWLLTGEGSMIKEEIEVFEPPLIGLPLLPIQAIAGFFAGDVQVMNYECEQYVVPMFQGCDFLIPVLGDSMYPTYNNGDVIACKKLDTWSFFQYGKVYVIYTSQGVILKRVRQGSSEGKILLVSDNEQSYPAFELNLREIIGVALVIGGIWLE